MFHRGTGQAVEEISRFAKLNRGALEQLKLVALSQMRSIKVRLRPRKLKMDLGGETSAGHFEQSVFVQIWVPKTSTPQGEWEGVGPCLIGLADE